MNSQPAEPAAHSATRPPGPAYSPNMALSILFPPTLGKIRASARAQLLAESLSRKLGERAMVRIAEDYGELERKVLQREVDVAWAPPSICSQAETAGLRIFKAVRQGRSMYRAALVCRASDERTLDSLQGTRAAWVDRLSTGGYLLPISTLRQKGYDPAALFRDQHFHESYQGALLSVIRGHADLSSIYAYGETDADVRRSLSEHVGASEVQLRALAFTDESPSDGLICATESEHVLSFLSVPSRDRSRELLLELLEAESLELADHNDYWPVRQALVQLP